MAAPRQPLPLDNMSSVLKQESYVCTYICAPWSTPRTHSWVTYLYHLQSIVVVVGIRGIHLEEWSHVDEGVNRPFLLDIRQELTIECQYVLNVAKYDCHSISRQKGASLDGLKEELEGKEGYAGKG